MRRRSAPSGVAACRRRTRGQRSQPKPGKRLRASVAQLDPVTSPFLRRKARRANKSDSGIHSGPKLPQRELFSRRHTDTRLVAECNTWLWREGRGGGGAKATAVSHCPRERHATTLPSSCCLLLLLVDSSVSASCACRTAGQGSDVTATLLQKTFKAKMTSATS